jgi:hypothetical protein
MSALVHHRVDWISGRNRSEEFRLLSRWFRQACRIRARFASCLSGDFDPLGTNETASVGILAAAASRSGLLTLTDYVSVKRGWDARAPYRAGRCDLWVADPERQISWAFEFKQGLIGRGARPAKMGKLLDQACFDASRVDHLEADHRYGALIVAVQERNSSVEVENGLTELSTRASYCCRLDGGATPIWLYLRSV